MSRDPLVKPSGTSGTKFRIRRAVAGRSVLATPNFPSLRSPELREARLRRPVQPRWLGERDRGFDDSYRVLRERNEVFEQDGRRSRPDAVERSWPALIDPHVAPSLDFRSFFPDRSEGKQTQVCLPRPERSPRPSLETHTKTAARGPETAGGWFVRARREGGAAMQSVCELPSSRSRTRPEVEPRRVVWRPRTRTPW